MSKQKGKVSVGCRIAEERISEIDAAAEYAGMNRSEWICFLILKALGKRPRQTLASRVGKLEQRVRVLEEA